MSIASTATAAVSVAEYSARIVRSLRLVGGAVVEGEVQKPRTTPGKMLVFDLTDGTAKLACKVFRSQVAGLEHQPRHGDLVQVRIDRPDLWVSGGKLDAIVSEIRLAGEGELLRRREDLLARLTAEGLCDPSRRPPRPRFPRAVGVIAGQGSDGLRDVIAALQNRFPPVHIVTCTAIVQGAKAPLDIIDALVRLDDHPLVDVIVIARGGGSVQDLIAFDDERLCRAVSACRTPVVAAIGHTDNVPVCNHVAWASETPSRAPELVVPSASDLRQELALAAAMMAPLPARVRTLSGAVAAISLDAAGLLSARQVDVAEAVALLSDSEHGFFAERQAGLGRAREALAVVPGRLPERADVETLGGRLDTRAVTFFAARINRLRIAGDFGSAVTARLNERTERVREAAAELRCVAVALASQKQVVARAAPAMSAVVAALDSRRAKAREEGNRLRAGIRKELADHVRDYPRALARHMETICGAAAQRISAELVHVDESGTRLSEGGRSRLADAKYGLDHITAVLAASDPRARGWVLPTKHGGGVVRSVKELLVGDRLTLSFHDGAAGAVIDNVPNQEVP